MGNDPPEDYPQEGYYALPPEDMAARARAIHRAYWARCASAWHKDTNTNKESENDY